MSPERQALRERFFKFMIERERIRLRKEAGLLAPWTEDPILHRYKFTNVRREHDKTSRLLAEEFYEPNREAPYREVLLNCAIARYFGTIEFMRAVGWQTELDPDLLKRVAKERLANKERVFTGAYVITNQGISAPKYEVVVDRFLTPLWAKIERLTFLALQSNSWETLITELQTVPGFGGSGFMAKEVVLDTTYTAFWRYGLPRDWNTWCPAGPGAQRGIRRLWRATELKNIKRPVRFPEALIEMRDLLAHHHDYWPNGLGPLCLHDIQFQLCEFDKYERVRLGQGKPRSRYHHARNNSNA